MALLISLLSLACTVVAAPNIGLPINSQVPPVARIDKPFHFTFSDSTFSSTTGNITYAMVDAPAWLQLDASRTLSGSPALHDAGSVNFSLIATDLAGSTTMSVTLVISTDPGPGVGRPVKEQLAAHDGYQGPDTVLLPHSSALSLSFSPDTFVDIDHDTVYYAMSANNTPLPSWITFNPSSLSFSGTAPQNTSPDELPQTFGVQFTASDVPGFSAAVASFQLILENHILIFEQPSYAATMTQGKSFTYTGLRDALMLNGHPIGPVNVKQIHADVPSWASFDQSTWTLSGVPPPSASSQEVSVAATDIYGEVATTTVVLQVSTNGTTDLSDNFVGRVNATPDKDFNYLFNRMLITNPEAELAVDLGAASPWLRYDQADLELSGRVPRDLQPQDVILNVTLTQGSVVQSEPLIIVVQPATHSSNGRSTGTPSPVASSGSAIPSQKPTPSSQSHETAQGLGYSNSRMAAAIAVPVIAVCLLMILACFIIARRRRRQISTDRNADSKRKVSRPFTFYANSDRESTGAVVEKAPPAPKSASSRVPMIDLPDFITSVASKRRSWFRLSKGTTDEPAYNPNTDSWHQYMQGLSTGKQKKAAAPQFSLLPEEQASSVGQGSRISSSKNRSRGLRPSSAVNVCPSKRTGPKKRRSDVTFANPGLRQNRRMSGFGHGRNGASLSNSYLGWSPVGMGHGKGGPPGFGRVRESWRNTSSGSWAPTDSPLGGSDLASSKYNSSERSQNVASIRGSLRRSLTSGTLDYYPQPPVIHEMKTGHRTSIRAIEPDPPQTYGLPLHVFHKRRARNRHYRGTFFAAGPSSRASSHLNWIQSVHTPVLSPTQSTNSTNSMISKRRTSRLERFATRPTYSQSSSVEPRTSPPKRASGASRNGKGDGLAALISTAITQRFQSSKSSLTSSHPGGGSAASREMDHQNPGLELEMDRDEEGNREWRYRDIHPDPLVVHRPRDDILPLGSPEVLQDDGVEGSDSARPLGSVGRPTEGMARQLQRPSYLRQRGAEGGQGTMGVSRLVMGGSRAKRPVSVDNGLVARGRSMRGDLMGEDGEAERDVAFL